MDERERLALRIARDALDTDPQSRTGFVSLRCGADSELRDQVDQLLQRIANGQDGEVADQEARDALIGTMLGPFRVVERIGRGGMGVVYRGVREGADFTQTVALKLIRRGFDFDDVQARFLRERRILSRLSHPQLARFIDGGVAADGRPWFALEFVSGQSITRWCDERRLDIRARVELFLDVCAAVQYAHTQLVVHRDLKPGNILVDENGKIRLLDFGISRLLEGDGGDDSSSPTLLSRSGLTPEYAAPEQFFGSSAVVASDIYALGMILYELIAGVLPYRVDRNDLLATEKIVRETLPQSLVAVMGRVASPAEEDETRMPPVTVATDVWSASSPPVHNMANHSNDSKAATVATTVWPTDPLLAASNNSLQPPIGAESTVPAQARLNARRTSLSGYRRTVRGDLTRIVEKTLAKEPDRRYATVEAFSDDLSRWLAGAPVRVTGNGLGYRLRKFVGRNRMAVAISALLLIALLAATGLALNAAHRERIQRDAAIDEAARSDAVREYVMLMFGDAAERPGEAKSTARDVLKHSAEEIFTRYKDKPLQGQGIALGLSELYIQLGDVEGAAPLLNRLLRWPGIEANPVVLASARYDLAQAEYARGNAKLAVSLLDQAQAYWEAQPERFGLILNESRSMQAQVARAQGDPKKAVAILEHAIAKRRTLLSEPDRDSGAQLNSLALALSQLGRYAEAVDRTNEGYRIFQTLGLGKTGAAIALVNNRANAEIYLGNYSAAEADLRNVVDLRRQLYGESPELAALQNNLATVLVHEKHYAEAATLIESSLRISLAQAGEAGRSTIALRTNLAELYVEMDRVDEAAPLVDAAVRTAQSHYGADSEIAGNAYRARAKVEAKQVKIPAARADLEKATKIFTAMGKGGEIYLKTLEKLRADLQATSP